MESEGVVPDVIDKTPDDILEVTYPQGKVVHFGNELTPTEVKDVPEVKWKAEPHTYYTLAMVDPDAPSRQEPKFREVKHWLVGNILDNDLASGDTITAYLGSGPPKGTGLHRYVFLVYKQEGKITFNEPKTPSNSREHRLSFSIRKFADKYKLGQPIAGNFYKAQWDSYVEIRNKNITN